MVNHTTTSRYFSILFAAIAFLFIQTHHAFADTAKKFADQDIFYQQAYLLLSTKKYKELDQQFQHYLDSYTRNEITAEELSIKFEAFAKMPSLDPRFDEWVNAFPESYSARLARGIFRTADAWGKRGGDFARNTTDNQFRGFHEILQDARTDILYSLKLHPRPIDSYRYLIRISKGLSLGNERDMLDAALKIDPKAYDPRFEYFDSITPKWGGDEGMMASFLEESKKSPMNDLHKKRIEGKYYYSLAEQAKYDRDYKTAATYFYEYYLTNNLPSALQSSGQAALDGDFKELAFKRFDELARKHTDFPYGFELRGYLYELHYKDIDKSIKDYLAAAELGANWSQNRLGWFYMMGINVPVDYIKAKHYLDLAAKQGNRTAMENLDILKQLRSKSGETSPSK